jgi:hypothetical protein
MALADEEFQVVRRDHTEDPVIRRSGFVPSGWHDICQLERIASWV